MIKSDQAEKVKETRHPRVNISNFYSNKIQGRFKQPHPAVSFKKGLWNFEESGSLGALERF